MTCDEWPITWPCGTDGVSVEPTADPSVLASVRQAAQLVLRGLTGGRIGLCETTEWFAPGSSECEPSDRRLVLSAQPAYLVETVEVRGEALPQENWRLGLNAVYPVGYTWPFSTPSDPAVRVRYKWGIPLVEGTLLWGACAAAMGEMAAELLKGACGGVCSLPSRVGSIARQGVDVEFIEPEVFVEHGLTGLPLSDALIRSTNVHAVSPSRVFSPDDVTGV